MSKEALAALTIPLTAEPHKLRPMPDWEHPARHQAREQINLDTYILKLVSTSNQKIDQLAALASANALAHERARVLEKQLAHSQELLVKAREELAGKTEQLQQQQARTANVTQLHARAVIRHLQGQLGTGEVRGLAQKLRGQHQATIRAY